MIGVRGRGRGIAALSVAVCVIALGGLAGPSSSPAAFPGKNGLIAFDSSRQGNDDIFLMKANGSDVTPLTSNPADETSPSFSANGKRIAYVTDFDGDREIFTRKADGTGPVKRVTNNDDADYGPTWSPDGKRLAYVSTRDGDEDIFKARKDGSGEKPLTENDYIDERPAWSPNGKWIAYDTEAGGSSLEVYKMRPNGTDKRDLTEFPAELDFSASWAPDGRSLCFSSNRDSGTRIFVMAANGDDQEPLIPTSSRSCAFSPNGKRLVAVGGGDDIYTANADGSDFTVRSSDGVNAGPDWGRRPG